MQARATSENWAELKSQTQAKTESKLVDSVSDQEVKKAVGIMEVADKLLSRICELAEKSTEGNIKTLTSALKDIRDIKGVKSDADMREQEARIAKLQREAEADKNNDDKPHGVVLMPPIMDDLIPPKEEDDG